MAVHDTIGDFLTVIRNAGSAGRPSCLYPHSKLRSGIASILKSRGFVEKFDELESDKGLKQIEIYLKYVNGEHAMIARINPVEDHIVVTESYQMFLENLVSRCILPRALWMIVMLEKQTWR